MRGSRVCSSPYFGFIATRFPRYQCPRRNVVVTGVGPQRTLPHSLPYTDPTKRVNRGPISPDRSMATSLSQEGRFGPVIGSTPLALEAAAQMTGPPGSMGRGTGNSAHTTRSRRGGEEGGASEREEASREQRPARNLASRGADSAGSARRREVVGPGASAAAARRAPSRRSGVRWGPNLSKTFVRSLVCHINQRTDPRRREDLRLMVEKLKFMAGRPGVDMRQELRKEAILLLGPALAKEVFAASLEDVRREYLRTHGGLSGDGFPAFLPARPAQRRTAPAERVTAAMALHLLGDAAERRLRVPTLGAPTSTYSGAVSGRRVAPVIPWGGVEPVGVEMEEGGRRMAGGEGGGVSEHGGSGGSRGAMGEIWGVQEGAGWEDTVGSLTNAPMMLELMKQRGGEGKVKGSREDYWGGNSIMDPEEVAERLRALHKDPQDEDFHLCCVCLVRPRDAAMIHGKTSHQSCCFICATELMERGSPCPCCRQCITLVVRNYL